MSNSKWNFVNISYLTNAIEGYIDTPFPYIIGVPRKMWKKIKHEKSGGVSWLQPDTSVFDLEKNKFKIKESLQDFPATLLENAYNLLLEILNKFSSPKV